MANPKVERKKSKVRRHGNEIKVLFEERSSVFDICSLRTVSQKQMGKKKHSQYISEKCRMILEKDEGCQDLAEKENN